jgi:hypothetical protein
MHKELQAGAGMKEDDAMISEIDVVEDEGQLLEAYPIDESQTVSNAGTAELFRHKGKIYEIITWNERAEEHKAGSKEMTRLGKRAYNRHIKTSLSRERR